MQKLNNIPKDFKKLVSIINPDSFITDMHSIGEIKKITGNYSEDCRLLCNNALAWIIKKIKETSYIYQIEIVEGSFDSYGHAWVKAGDYYLDITLAQFIDCPKIVVSKIGAIKGYQEKQVYNPINWARKICKEMGWT